MREQILARFNDNISRVKNLVAIHRDLGGEGQGRRPLHATDILRGATVLLHAALEEAFRAVGTWRLPGLGEGVLNDVPLVGLGEAGRPEKFWLGKLATHRTKTVQQVIDESVRAHMNYFSVNNTTDVASFLRKVGVEPQPFEHYFPVLNDMIRRRHHIVHQADRNDQPGTGHQRALSLSVARVDEWTETTEQFVLAFLQQVPDELL